MKRLEESAALKKRIEQALESTPYFSGLSKAHVRQVAAEAVVYGYGPGDALMRVGEASDSFFLILQGEVSVRLAAARGDDELVEVARLGPPTTLGEMGLLTGKPRSASVFAVDKCVALRFEERAFEQLCRRLPEFSLAIARELSQRLDAADQRLPVRAITEVEPSPECAALLPVDFMRGNRVVPLETKGNRLILGVLEDPGRRVISGVRKLAPGMEIEPVRVPREALEAYLQQLSRGGGEGLGVAEPAPGEPWEANELEPLLRRMVAEGASDLHLSAMHRPRWRVDGQIELVPEARTLGEDDVLAMLDPRITIEESERFEETSDLDFGYSVDGLARFRVNVFRDHRGVSAVMRQIPNKILTVEELGLPAVITDFCGLSKGLVVVTGPTGSGKSTTLAAMVDHINRHRAEHILTVEDPIEFVHHSRRALVNQREAGVHTRDFASALKAALREDPDVVLIGEMRDLETVRMALETASTGHLVFGTLHTSTAAGTIDRIIGQFPSDEQEQIRTMLADSLKGVVAQCLCRKEGGGRVGAFETLVVSHAVSNLIREAKTFQIENTMQTSRAGGNQLLNDALAGLVRQGKVSPEEALSRAINKDDLRHKLRATSGR